MLFAKSFTGMEISQNGVTCALLGGSSAVPRLERVASSVFPENTLQVSLREHNILEPELFVDRVRSAHNLLLTKSGRVSVSLPDSVGRILLLDLEGRFKSRAEALDLIRWKLKKSIPFDVADTHLDYQKLSVRENGDMSLLVAVVSKKVIGQYEELLVKAGLSPARIDFNSFNLCRVFEKRMSLTDDCILIYFYENTLGIICFYQGLPEFVRIKDLSGAAASDSRIYMEVNSSLMVYKDRFPERSTSAMYCLTLPAEAQDFKDLVEEATGGVPAILDIKSAVLPGNAAPGDQNSLYKYTASIGAALRNF